MAWDVDTPTVSVTGVTVHVPGCADGDKVGIQLITDDGDRPVDGPRGALVEDERAIFDVADLNLRIEPITGIRVFLAIDGVDVPVMTVTVEQRFFNQAGNEQRGLRQTTLFNLAVGARYRVPNAGDGYRDVGCSTVNSGLSADARPQGPGTFVVESSALHVVCYQQVPGTPGGPGPGGPGTSVPPDVEPPAELPEVLDSVIERGEDPGDGTGAEPGAGVGVGASPPGTGTEVLGEARDADRVAVRGSVLSRTGFEAITGASSGLLLVLLGAGLIRRFRTAS